MKETHSDNGCVKPLRSTLENVLEYRKMLG